MNYSNESKIEVHSASTDPQLAWHQLFIPSDGRVCRTVESKPHDAPRDKDTVRFVCISDTHNKLGDILDSIPEGDVLLHAGDFTYTGDEHEVVEFNKCLAKLPHKYKIVIAGNHDLFFDVTNPKPYGLMAKKRFAQCFYNAGTSNIILQFLWFLNANYTFMHFAKRIAQWIFAYMLKFTYDLLSFKEKFVDTFYNTAVAAAEDKSNKQIINSPRKMLTDCIYLEDNSCELFGYKIYGSPWQPEYGGWAFNLPRGQQLLNKWNCIPDDTDILITHGPPLGHGDLARGQFRSGCVELLNTIEQRVKPLYHVYGHIHEGHGITTNDHTIFINAAICDLKYRPSLEPIIFDLPVKK